MEFRIVLPENKNDICRFCLSINENVSHSLFQEKEPTKLHELLSNLQLEIVYDEILPNNVCSNCENQLQAIHSFKFMIIDNENILKSVYYDAKAIDTECINKIEIEEEDKQICKQDGDSDFENSLDNFCDLKDVDEIIEETPKVKRKRKRLEPTQKPSNRSKISPCETCGKLFRKDYLKKHRDKCKGYCVKEELNILVEDKNTPHICTVCSEVFESELRLLLHYIQHFLYAGTEKIDPVVFCNFCGYILKTYEEYLAHVSEKHPESGSKSWICKLCQANHSTEFELVAHMHTTDFCTKINVNINDRNCLLCKKEFEGSLSNHIKNHLLKRHGCLKCDDKFITLSAHNNHLVSHPEYKHRCNYCMRMFVLKSNMEKHIKEMHQDEKYICEICSKLFNRKNNLDSHIRQKHDDNCKKIICFLCGYSTVSKHDLKRHERFHTNEKPFKCNFDECTKAYKTSSALSHHKKTHLNIRNYRCDICEKSFYTSNHLKDHMYIHTGERNFICQFCEHSFKRKDQLSSHIKIHKQRDLRQNALKS